MSTTKQLGYERIPVRAMEAHSARTSSSKGIIASALARFPFTAIWMPVAAFGIHAKSVILGEKQWRILAHAFHRSTIPPIQDHFSHFERASLYFSDWSVGFFLIPIALVLMLFVLPRRLWAAFVALVSVCACVLTILQMESLRNVGHFIPWYLIYDVFHWAAAHPHFVVDYGSRGNLARWSLFVLLIGAFAFVMHRFWRPPLIHPTLAKTANTTLAIFAFAGISAAVFRVQSNLAQTSYGRSTIATIFSATFFGNEDVGTGATAKSPAQLHQEYFDIAQSRRTSPNPVYWAKAHGCDVILFILETAPARYDAFTSLDDLPTLRQLAAQSWIGASHYSTFPYTAKATFSILTSMYPPNPMFFGGRTKQVPGLVRSLSSAGYTTHYYIPHDFESHFEQDMYYGIGFDKVQVSSTVPDTFSITPEYYKGVEQRDMRALKALLQDVHQMSQHDQRYLAVFSPQIGHAPWPDLVYGGAEKSLGRRARALLELQDQWLGQIVHQLAQDGRLDKTIIVITGDHGIRTSTEDPSFEPYGLLPDYSFHVPLLIYASMALSKSQTITALTSHIDIAPTVLDLVGIQKGRDYEQGQPIWDVSASHRKVFLWAGDYLGADGYAQDHQFAVWNRVANFVFTGNSLNEDTLRIARTGSPEEGTVDEEIRAMTKLDANWWVSSMPPVAGGAAPHP
jgi:arylsulfatase A-like enzyme